MNELQVFNSKDFSVRTIEDNGEIWFVAKDIAQALEYSYWQPNIVSHVPECWKGIKRINTPGGEQEMLCLTEQGVYFFLGRSDKPKALPYQMWIAGDVVPSIRKHGAYLTPQAQEELITNPDFIIRLAQELKAERIKVKALQEQAEKDRPKVIFADSVEASKDSILVRELAKLLRQNGVLLGEKRLYRKLRERGYLIKSGSDYNMPSQKSMELGLMEVLERTINRGDGKAFSTRTTKITGKGQVYFINLFLK